MTLDYGTGNAWVAGNIISDTYSLRRIAALAVMQAALTMQTLLLIMVRLQIYAAPEALKPLLQLQKFSELPQPM